MISYVAHRLRSTNKISNNQEKKDV